MKDKEQTFTLSELKNERFWEKVLYVEKWHSSGLGGAGCLWIITSEKLLYQISFETFPYDENQLELFHTFFEIESYDKELWRNIYKIESKGWKYIGSGKNIWIRQEYAAEFERLLQELKGKQNYLFMPEVFARLIGVEGEISRVREEKFAQLLKKRAMEEAIREKERERIKIQPRHLAWKPLYMNNTIHMPQVGEYLLVFKKRDCGVKAYKFSIVYQMPQEEPMVERAGTLPELYILQVNEYDEVNGPFEYPDVNNNGATNKINFEHTFHNLDMNNYGEFVRAFKSMEEAKEYCAAIVTLRYQITLENIFFPN